MITDDVFFKDITYNYAKAIAKARRKKESKEDKRAREEMEHDDYLKFIYEDPSYENA